MFYSHYRHENSICVNLTGRKAYRNLNVAFFSRGKYDIMQRNTIEGAADDQKSIYF